MTEKKCLVCGEDTVDHVNRFDRVCRVCGIISIGERPAPMIFMGDPEDYEAMMFGPTEKVWEPTFSGVRQQAK